jgi:hypothetical protein
MPSTINELELKPPRLRSCRRPGPGRPSVGPEAKARVKEQKRRTGLPEVIRDLVREVRDTDRDPLRVLLEIANDRKQPTLLRMQAAAVAVKFVRPALSAAAIQVQNVEPKADAAPAIQTIMGRLDRLAVPSPIEAALPSERPAGASTEQEANQEAPADAA